MVTHDRYFMDRLVDHVFVLDGSADVKDIHGNYTDYRESYTPSIQNKVPQKEKTVVKSEDKPVVEKKKVKLSFKEQTELKNIESDLEKLEKEKSELMIKMTDSKLSHVEMAKVADRYKVVESSIEIKTFRWLELQEKEA
jgi:ABC transport system ATP-binding/permease protein